MGPKRTTRRELLAVVMALQHFVLGQKVIPRTDHHSIKWLKTSKQPEGILDRWIETLAEYDYDIAHRLGRMHSNADAPMLTCSREIRRPARYL